MTREEKQKAIDALKTSVPIMAVTQEEFNDYIRTLNKVMDWLEQEPSNSENSNKSEIPTGSTNKNNLAVDCISRADALDCVNWGYSFSDIYKKINELPTVTPQPKTGHWIWCVGSHKCSNCEEYTCFSHKELLRYCPNCGAKMVEPQESEG